MNRIGFLILAAAALGTGCTIPDDLDSPCHLTSGLPDGGAQQIPTSNTSAVNPSFDFISTGNSECEDLICIRLANPASGFYDDSDGFFHGRCSNNCITKADCGAASKGLTCSQLSFDQSFIDGFCSTDPADCSTIFGTDTSATFCIDPNGTKNASGS